MTTHESEAAPPLTGASADEIVGERVHQIMWRRRLNQGDLAEALGIQQPALSRKLRGLRTWTVDELLVTASYLGVAITDLLPGNDYAPVLSGRGRSGGSVRHQGLEPRTRWFRHTGARLGLVAALIEEVGEQPEVAPESGATVTPLHPASRRGEVAAGARTVGWGPRGSSSCESRPALASVTRIGDAS